MRFSVIIPLYNKAPYVRKTLESAIGQTFDDYEIVVVDDGSSDGSAEIAEEILKSGGKSFQLIRQKNSGVSAARNVGINISNGEFICFLDGDDWWDCSFLNEIDTLILQYPDSGLYCTNYYYVHNGKNTVKLDIPYGPFNYCKEYARTQCMSATSSSTCIKKDILNETGGFKTSLKLGEDFDLWIRVALKYGSVINDKPLAYYNNDLPSSDRATHHLHKPESHMLWNLDYLSYEEKINPDYKQLIDNLRVYSLFPYFLSPEYHDMAKKELGKVDWSKQPDKKKSLYLKPLWYLRIRQKTLTYGSKIKKWIIKHI